MFVDFKIFFDCPVHGFEDQIFCFRHTDPELRDRWIKYEVLYKRVEITQEEIDEFLGEKKT